MRRNGTGLVFQEVVAGDHCGTRTTRVDRVVVRCDIVVQVAHDLARPLDQSPDAKVGQEHRPPTPGRWLAVGIKIIGLDEAAKQRAVERAARFDARTQRVPIFALIGELDFVGNTVERNN